MNTPGAAPSNVVVHRARSLALALALPLAALLIARACANVGAALAGASSGLAALDGSAPAEPARDGAGARARLDEDAAGALESPAERRPPGRACELEWVVASRRGAAPLPAALARHRDALLADEFSAFGAFELRARRWSSLPGEATIAGYQLSMTSLETPPGGRARYRCALRRDGAVIDVDYSIRDRETLIVALERHADGAGFLLITCDDDG